jgi:filamentous hemagglutinin family protein
MDPSQVSGFMLGDGEADVQATNPNGLGYRMVTDLEMEGLAHASAGGKIVDGDIRASPARLEAVNTKA